MLEKQAKIAFLSIGSNLGNRKKNIELAKFKLEKNSIKIIKISNKGSKTKFLLCILGWGVINAWFLVFLIIFLS